MQKQTHLSLRIQTLYAASLTLLV